MSNSKDTPGSSVESIPEPPSSSTGGRTEEAERPSGEGWFDRLRAAVGLKSSSVRRELQEALVQQDADNAFSVEERTLLNNILHMREVRVSDIMVPRADVCAIEIDATLAELMAEFKESGHSRMPVYRDSLDEPAGMVHVKDFMNYIAGRALTDPAAAPGASFDLAGLDFGISVADSGLVRDVLFVPPSMPVATLLSLMQSRRVQMALVIDEFGGTDGLVSIEDAVETIVGEIEDEHAEEEPEIVADGPDTFIADAGARLADVAKFVGGDLARDRSGEDVETIGGVVFGLLGRIPAEGEVVLVPGGYEIVILESDPRRIRKLQIRRLPTDVAEDPVSAESRPRAATGT